MGGLLGVEDSVDMPTNHVKREKKIIWSSGSQSVVAEKEIRLRRTLIYCNRAVGWDWSCVIS